ncbi:MAG: ParB/RepB/Spo0J family partition protein, partial [Gammaproteobacteria bacterium]|nr:ParB/RepB/Spo0J family partition protein [Gammaproteobacteria bacterium]
RRLRAGKIAGLSEVPCIVQKIDDATAAMINVLENLHREDLNVVEEAEGIRQLIEQHSLKHAEIATTLGQSRSTITNKLRILSLSPYSLDALKANKIEMGHAKCLLSVDEQKQKKFVDLIIKNGLSVRKLEILLKAPEMQPISHSQLSNPFIQKVESQLSKLFDAKTTIKNKQDGKGKIVIDFKSSDNLDKIISLMTKIYVEQ